MDAAGFGLTTVDLCIKYGRKLYDICQSYRNADQEVHESVLEIEGLWLKTQHQVNVIRNIWYELDEQVQVHQNSVLAQLQKKLQEAVSIISGLQEAASGEPSLKDILGNAGKDLKRVKYATSARRKLDDVVKDLDRWQKRFDPSWYMLARAVPSDVDPQGGKNNVGTSKELLIINQLRRAQRENERPVTQNSSVFLSSNDVDQKRVSVSNTSAEISHIADETVIIDPMNIADGNDPNVATKDVRDIARILSNVDPEVFSLLKCRGVAKIFRSAHLTGFEFVFTLPIGMSTPQSLRSFLLDANLHYPLDDRLHLSKLLARSVSFLHSAQIVHKNISPENIILLENSGTTLKSPFLVGFEKFRYAEGRTSMSGDMMWEKNLYRHPRRQGERPEEEYKIQHDIYSLGVCLLEIGLGISFVIFDPNAVRGAIPNTEELDIAEQLRNKDVRARSIQIKRKLVTIAEHLLPGKMGRTYAGIVVSCLTCLDRGNKAIGDDHEFTDEDGILVGVRYIEKIMIHLHICD